MLEMLIAKNIWVNLIGLVKVTTHLWGVWIILAEACTRTAYPIGVESAKTALFVGKRPICYNLGIIGTDAVFGAIGTCPLHISLPQPDESGKIGIL